MEQPCKRPEPGFILIVDDDADIRLALSQALQFEGYRTTTAVNGAEALKQMRQGGRPCLILLDLMMPVMNGWEFRVEQQQDPELAAIPVVILTGDGRIRQKQESLRVTDGLRKPVELESLLSMVASHCGEPPTAC